MSTFNEDIARIGGISAVPTILNVICETTGMGFAAIARVTEEHWITCSVLDKIAFGLKPGDELSVESTICHEVRQSRQPVVIDHVAEDENYCHHHTPRLYGFQSYISMPILLPSGEFFGTLCAIDPHPARVNTPRITGMFKLFAELIAFHIDAVERLERSESKLNAERQMSNLREQFIGVLGHDFRNPLWALSMGTTLLEEHANKEQIATLEMMKRSVTRMSDLIDDTLDFTRGRLGGGISLDSSSEIPVQQVLEQVIEETRARWSDRAIQSDFNLQEKVHYDRKRITQLFTNLLSNALIHGKKGDPVRVKAHSRDGKFEFSVSNSADPIPAPVLEHLFEPFSRGADGNRRQGLGLGLYIASEIAKSHGGTLSVNSTTDTVCFTFQMDSLGQPTAGASDSKNRIAEQQGTGTSSASDLQNPTLSKSARVLLVEDHEETRNALSRLLTRRGHMVIAASTGGHARAAYTQSDFDIIVSDLGLPDCYGLDLITELREVYKVPAIALSGYGIDGDIQRSQAAGFLEYLTKPVDFEQLIQTVDRLVHKPG